MKENELKFYTNTTSDIIRSIVLFIITIIFHFITFDYHSFMCYFIEMLLIYELISTIIQAIKSYQNKPTITLTDQSFIEHKIGYTIKWEDILKINKYGNYNRAIEIILKWNYTNYDTIKNPFDRFYLKFRNAYSSKRKYIYLNYMGGDVEEIVDVMNEFKDNIDTINTKH